MREDYVHFYVRKELKAKDWTLIAGEYPNGSDDELHPIYIKDPELARDDSPDHRRHSNNKLVPDLVAYKDETFLIIEMKPSFDLGDQEKLQELLSSRKVDLMNTLQEHLNRYFKDIKIELNKCTLVPTLGFNKKKKYIPVDDFTYLVVSDDGKINIEGNNGIKL